ncbi:MAG TPA: hypothetical protein VF444_19960 [Pseudonocardiaceae bacterium]
MKKHEDFLKTFQGGAPYDKVKFMENLVKEKFPDQFPWIKALSDAKSSKNWIGWIDKSAITVDKQLTDIQQQAEDAWNEANQQHQQQSQQP